MADVAPADDEPRDGVSDELNGVVGRLLGLNRAHEPGPWWRAGIDEALAGGPAPASVQTWGAVEPVRKSRGTERP